MSDTSRQAVVDGEDIEVEPEPLTVLVTPGTPAGPYPTAAETTNAMGKAVISPRDDVASDVRDLRTTETKYGPVLCGPAFDECGIVVRGWNFATVSYIMTNCDLETIRTR